MSKDVRNFAACAWLTALLLLCAYAAPVAAQRQAQRPEQTVYLPDVTGGPEATPSGSQISLGQFATTMLHLRLNALKGVRVVREKAPECAADPSVPGASQTPLPQNAPAQTPAPSQAPAQAQPPALAAADYYEIRASITAKVSGVSDPEMVLNYELIRYARCASKSIIRRSEPFTQQSVLQSMTLMSDVLALSVEEETAPRKLVVEVAEISGGGEPRRQLKTRLAEQVASQLAALGDVQPRLPGASAEGTPSADYQITGIMTTSAPARVTFTVRNMKSGATGDVSLRLPPGQQEEELARFFTNIADRVVRQFTALRLTDELNISVDQTTVNDAWAKAQELMCVGKPDCDPQPDAAISILAKLVEPGIGPTSARLELLGDAYRSTEDWPNAAQAYDKALPGIADNRGRISLLKKAGESWYQAKNFDLAATRFGQAVELSSELKVPVLTAVYLQWGRSHVFANNRLRALEALIKGMRAIPRAKPLEEPQSKVLDDEFEELLKEVKDDELIAAAPLMWANRDLWEVDDEMSAFTRRFVKEVFEETKLALAEGRFKAADEVLRKLEAAPAADLLDEEKAEARRLRAEWKAKSAANNSTDRMPLSNPA